MEKSDQQLQLEVEDRLRADARINAAQIGVAVDRGVVSLLGIVDTYAQKWAAEEQTRRVQGVCSIVQALTVKLLTEHKRTDAEIAAAINALRREAVVPEGVTASVQRGTVRLEGEVDSDVQRKDVEREVGNLAGVVTVNNYLREKTECVAHAVRASRIDCTQRRSPKTKAPARDWARRL